MNQSISHSRASSGVGASAESSSPADALLSASEVCRRLGIAQSGLYGILRRGELAYHRVGRLIRVRESDLVAYLAAARVERSGPPVYVGRP